MSPHIIQLDKNYRQADDEELKGVLERIRAGKFLRKDVCFVYSRMCSIDYLAWSRINPTFVFSRNDVVAKLNETEYCKNGNTEHVYVAQWISQPINNVSLENTLKSQLVVPFKLCLKIGVLVMVRKNVSVSQGISNGTRGIVSNLGSNWVEIELPDSRKFTLNPVIFELSDGDRCFKISQIPVCLAYAFTIHKLQGTTIRGPLCMNLGLKYIFAPFQAYVALSRVTSRDDIYLLDFDPSAFKIDVRVQRFFKSNTPLSTEDLFETWSSFFCAPEHCRSLPLSGEVLLDKCENFRLDAKSWILVRTETIESSINSVYELDAYSNLAIQASQLIRERDVHEEPPRYMVRLTIKDTINICTTPNTDEDCGGTTVKLVLSGGKTLFVYFLGFCFFSPDRKINITN